MLKRLLSRLAISTLIAGCCFALSGTSLPASQDVPAQALPAMPDTPPVVPSDPSVDRQMLELEHHAQVNMILYSGRFSQGESAATRKELDAVALTVKAGSQ